MEPIISVSGLRGIVGESLTPEVALRFACAFAQEMPPGPIVVTRDGRASGPMLADAVRSGLAAAGRNAIDAGVAATPTTGILVRQHQAAGGLQISASHNPASYNGLKLFSAAGRVLPAAAGETVLKRYRSGRTAWVPHDQLGKIAQVAEETAGDAAGQTASGGASRHAALVLATVDVERIRRRHFRVLLDANHGAGSVLGRELLTALGCETTVLGGQPDGAFEHLPEPTAANLASVLPRVATTKSQVGFCQDPDADRLAIVDERGQYLGEEYTLALCANHILAQRKGPVVTNCSTSRMTEDVAARHGVPFHRSAVGEANVVDCMLAHGAVLGGEGNGGVIDPRVGLVRDSFSGMALVLDAMAARECPVSRLAAELPRYDIVKTTIVLERDKMPAALAALEQHFAGAAVDRLDGLRLDWPGKWLLVRGSNTEPIVRAIAEAPTEAEAQDLCSAAAQVLAMC